jgi:hypothetical protein
MSDLELDDVPDVADAAHQAANGQVVYLIGQGQRLAAIVPAEFAAALEDLTPEQVHELLEELADAVDVRKARAARENGEPVIAWEQAKADADL